MSKNLFRMIENHKYAGRERWSEAELRPSHAAAVEVKNVSKTFRSGSSSVEALRNVTLELQLGELIVLSGPSGSGKTTLLNIIAGLDRPTEGDVLIFGTRLNDLREHALADLRSKSLGFVFQEHNLVSSLSASENVELARELAGHSAAESSQTISRLLDMVGVSDKSNALPRQMSGGEKQRVAFARALANDPPILLADEPTGNLDEDNAGIIARLLESMRTVGKAVLCVSHDPLILEKASRRLGLNRGALV